MSTGFSVVVTYNTFPFDCQITPTYVSASETGTKKCVSQRERVPHWWFTLFLAEDWSQIASGRRRRLCVIPPVVSMSCLLRNQWPPSITAKFALSRLSRHMPELCCGHDASLKSRGRDGSAVGLVVRPGPLKQKQIRGLVLYRFDWKLLSLLWQNLSGNIAGPDGHCIVQCSEDRCAYEEPEH